VRVSVFDHDLIRRTAVGPPTIGDVRTVTPSRDRRRA
jgi:hypothetical protein